MNFNDICLYYWLTFSIDRIGEKICMHLIVIFVLWSLYFGLHSLLADSRVKQAIHKYLPSLHSYYRVFYNLISVFGFLVIWFYQREQLSARLFSQGLISGVGLAILLLGAIGSFFALRGYSLEEFSGLKYLKKENNDLKGTLKTDGMNAWVRHPLYFFTFLIFWGWFLWKQTDVSLVLASVVTLYLIIGSILEEKKLVRAFGDEYLAYQRRVKMLVPFLF